MPSPTAPPRGLAVVDVEASGRVPWRHRVVEVGVVLLDYPLLRVVGEFSTLVDPGGPVGPSEVHGIAQPDVVGAPSFRELAPQLLTLLRGRLLVGHHVRCDQEFIRREFARTGTVLPDAPSLCTMALADRVLGLGPRSLGACCEAAGFPLVDAHTALGDARAAAELLRRCLATPEGGAVALGRLVGAAAGVPWPRPARGTGRTVPAAARATPRPGARPALRPGVPAAAAAATRARVLTGCA
ncbi:exonuclease domain-containing protein [Streptacidiphilus sp. N1-12]|uniref:Exonuclease domain-containing protein n=2 Tax=Streptacidiphilus alkalitolerans TaxID=3342712 RepID=A0ABV6VAC7_9ACTN